MIMRQLFALVSVLLAVLSLSGCNSKSGNLYDPKADAMKQLDAAIEQADRNGKLVLAQVGGDWCKWCRRLNAKILNTAELKSIIDSGYVWVHIYYGKDNKNEAAMERMDHPESMGFPALVLIDGDGTVVRLQETGAFEQGEDYDVARLAQFLRTDWQGEYSHLREMQEMMKNGEIYLGPQGEEDVDGVADGPDEGVEKGE